MCSMYCCLPLNNSFFPIPTQHNVTQKRKQITLLFRDVASIFVGRKGGGGGGWSKSDTIYLMNSRYLDMEKDVEISISKKVNTNS